MYIFPPKNSLGPLSTLIIIGHFGYVYQMELTLKLRQLLHGGCYVPPWHGRQLALTEPCCCIGLLPIIHACISTGTEI